MPNWCSNEVIITGTPSQITRLLAEATRGGDRFIFKNIHPCPESLRQVSAGSQEDCYYAKHGTEMQWRRITRSPRYKHAGSRADLVAALEQQYPDFHEKADQYKRNIDEHGHLTWYSWCLENWGTKWDVEAHVAPREDSDDVAQLNFDSAWSPPLRAFEEISRRFPELAFECRYFEEGNDFIGFAVIEKGIVVAEDEDDLSSPDAVRFFFRPQEYVYLDGEDDE